jgi:hypothetical protein
MRTGSCAATSKASLRRSPSTYEVAAAQVRRGVLGAGDALRKFQPTGVIQ